MPTYPFRLIINYPDAPDALAHALLGIWGAAPEEVMYKVLQKTSIDTREEYGAERTVQYTAGGPVLEMQTWDYEDKGKQQVISFSLSAFDCRLTYPPEDTTLYTLEAPPARAEQVLRAIFPRFGHDVNHELRLKYILAGTDPQLLIYNIVTQPPTPQGTTQAQAICTAHRAQMPEYEVALLKALAHQCRQTDPGLQIKLLDEALMLDVAQHGPDAAPGYWTTLLRAEAERGNLPEANRRATHFLATALPAHRPVCGEVCRLMGELTHRFATADILPGTILTPQDWYRRGAQEYGNEACQKWMANAGN